MIQITVEDYIAFHTEFYKTQPQYLRFGQAFFNKFLKHEDEVGNIFYETDNQKVIKIIF